jgi:hypothetical protein
VVFDAHIAGIPVSVIGIESRMIPRKGAAELRPSIVKRSTVWRFRD